MELDEKHADMLRAAACLLAAAAVKKVRAWKRCIRQERKRKSVWVRPWLLKRRRYGLYEKLMNHLREGAVRSFKNFVRIEPGTFNQMVADLTPRLKKTTTNCRKPLSVGLNLAITLRYLATGDSYKSLAYG